MPEHEPSRDVQAAVQIERRDHCLHGVRQNAVHGAQRRVAPVRRNREKAAEIEITGHPRQRLHADQLREPAGDFSLGLAGKPFQELFGNDQAQHPVAQEFQALVGVAGAGGAAGVREGAAQQAGSGKPVSQPPLQFGMMVGVAHQSAPRII